MHVTQRCNSLPHMTVMTKPRYNMRKQVGEKVPYDARLSMLTWEQATFPWKIFSFRTLHG